MSGRRKKLENNQENSRGERYCRTCAKLKSDTVPIFPCEETGSKFRDIIEKYLPIKISEFDCLPLHLCMKCAETLKSFEDLAEGVLLAQSQLEKILQNESEITDCMKEGVYNSNGESDSDDAPLSTKVKSISKKKKGRTKKALPIVVKSETVRRGKRPVTIRQKTVLNGTSSVVKQLCLFCLKSVRNLKKHMRKHDPCEKIDLKFCSFCGKMVEEIEKFFQHICSHFGVREISSFEVPSNSFGGTIELRCFLCPTTLPSRNAFIHHASLHLPVEKKPPTSLHCVACGKPMLRGTLRRHLVGHVSPQRFTCEDCGRQYAQESGLLRHIRVTHEGVRRYKCPVCPAILQSNSELRAHQDKHPDPRPFQCDTCGRTFLSQKQLYHHRKYHHTEGGLRVACNQCSRVFSSASVLRRHHKVVHLHLKEFQCEICSANLSTKQYLREHLRTHTNERPEVCAVCGKTFQMVGNLRQHMKTHMERAQVCDICGRRFVRRCQLLIHMSSHRDISQPACPVCGKKFLLKADLLKHSAEHDAVQLKLT